MLNQEKVNWKPNYMESINFEKRTQEDKMLHKTTTRQLRNASALIQGLIKCTTLKHCLRTPTEKNCIFPSGIESFRKKRPH